ncbi:MAG: phosphotransferase [Kiloniellales bacterium]|nr:phosphotransferase [Kiloniellales bacterium]
MADLPALHAALVRLPGFAAVAPADLVPLQDKGLAHDHIRVAGRGLLLRVPKQSQFGLSAEVNLRYQATCFERASRSGQAPKLHGLLPPSAALPMGALLVEEIAGRPPSLPRDLPALAACMARVHSLPLPPPEQRPPLEDHRDPVAGAMQEIEAQARFLDEAGLSAQARAEIEDELAWARGFRAEVAGRPQPITLVLTDTHPGNFLIEGSPDGEAKAVIVDLEKALYGSPGIDLAHATVYSSTTWDLEVYAELSIDEVAVFYRHYLEIAAPDLAAALGPWLVPLRRLLFLRAITWCAKWRVLHRRDRAADKHAAENAEDWSAENTDAATIAHVAGRVDDYLSAATLQRMRGEWRSRPGLEKLI